MSPWQRLAAWLLISLGLEAVAYFLSWWYAPGRIASLPLFFLFTFVAWFSAIRMIANWFALAHVARPRHRPPVPGLAVDVITTAAPGEPMEIFRATLPAMVQIRYPHATYLLDDSHRDELRTLSEELGIRYIRRDTPGKGGKAGNVNHGLALASGEFVAIFDPDHVPSPEFLDRILGYFDDPRVGFVQAAQAYRNQCDSLVARGAAEQTYELYGPTLMGLHGLGAPLLFGCHTTFRRAALDSIGGYAIHNAEDLRTCMRLYARKWKGEYVPEILARGLAPADLVVFLRQQYRWAHSVFDLFFRDYWRLLRRWTFYQGAAFFAVGTYYFVGTAILISLVLPLIFLGTGWGAVTSTTQSFLAHLAPLILVNFAIRRFAQRFLLSREERGWHLAGTVMLFASCFAHAAGLIAALRNVRVPYIVTAKGGSFSPGLTHVRLHALGAGVSSAAVLYSLWVGQPAEGWFLQICAVWNASMMGAIVWIAVDQAGGQNRDARLAGQQNRTVRGLADHPVVGNRSGC